jgi:glycine/serine hydroxymethyltransferase
VETIAIDRAKALFGVDHANVQPYSGSPANLAVYLAFAQPGDTIMGMALPMGGHLTHGWPVSATGKWFRPVQYGVRHDTGRVDLDEVRDLALGAPQDHLLRRHGDPADHRLPGLRRHRRRGGAPCWRTSRTSPG